MPTRKAFAWVLSIFTISPKIFSCYPISDRKLLAKFLAKFHIVVFFDVYLLSKNWWPVKMSKKWTFLVWKNSIRLNIVRRHNITNAFECSNCLELSLEISEEVTIPHYYQWADEWIPSHTKSGLDSLFFSNPHNTLGDVLSERLYDWWVQINLTIFFWWWAIDYCLKSQNMLSGSIPAVPLKTRHGRARSSRSFPAG